MELLIGFAKKDITPAVGIELCGYGFFFNRKSTGVLEPINARAMAWSYGDLRGVVIELEVLCITKQSALKIKELVYMACGIPVENIIVTCLHNHSAPCTCDMLGYGEPNVEYIAEFICRSSNAAIEACKNMKSSTLEYVTVPVQGIGYNREVENGVADPELRMLRVKSGDKLLGFLANYACHPVVLNRDTFQISSDFIGVAFNRICKKYNVEGLFLQGACGDINSVYFSEPEEKSLPQLKELSAKFAHFIEQALICENAEKIEVDHVSMISKEVDLPFEKSDKWLMFRHLRLIQAISVYCDCLPKEIRKEVIFEKESCEAIWEKMEKGVCENLTTLMQALRFGQFIIIAQPSELFYQYQKKVFDTYKGYRMMMAGYSNDYIGYIPPAEMYENYTAAAHWVPFVLRLPSFRKDVGKVFLKHMLDTIDAVIE